MGRDKAAERLRLHRCEDYRHAEFLSGLGQHYYVVNELLAFNICNTECHLRLMVDKDHCGVIGDVCLFLSSY